MKKILITGATGMLGAEIAHQVQKHKNQFEVYGTGRKDVETTYPYYQADLLNNNELNHVLNKVNPDIIIHCAANVNLNDCEINKEETDHLHIYVTGALASFKPGKCKIVYISTDSVFDGTKGNYTETDEPAPLNYYALSKLKGEQKAATNPYSLILRTNIYGFSRYGESNSLFEWLYKNLSNQNKIVGFTDTYFNPLYAGQLSEAIVQLLLNDIKGLLHVGCKEKVSKYHFASMVTAIFGLKKLLIEQGNSDIVHSIVRRPKNTTLNLNRSNTILAKQYSLKEGIEKLKNDFFNFKK